MLQRVRQAWEISRYGARQLILASRGKAYPIAQLDDLAWFASKRKKLPSAALEDLFPGITRRPIQLQHAVPKLAGNVSVEELCVIGLICQHEKPRKIFEFGTFNGRTTLNLAMNAPADAKVYTLDLRTPGQAHLVTSRDEDRYRLGNNSGYLFRDCGVAKKIEQLWSDSAKFDDTPYHGQMDLIFVDGAHTYEYVCNDTRKALAMLRAGGIILWHDYCVWYPGVVRCVEELMQNFPVRHIEGTHLAVLF
jgi:predicted O-methyltransferase YrrM